MAANPNPTRISNEMWWFVEEWERLEQETVYAGSWGDFKPGYHCDYYTLKHHSGWQNDYSVQLADDQVPAPHANERLGSAVDITFPSAQNGNFTNIKKYSSRIRTAWVNHDPRLKGWREVLCNADSDNPADGYDFVYWTERSPDDTHKWHMHFSVLRKYLRILEIYQAMMSILRGETLAQWQAKEDDMMTTCWLDDGFWLCNGTTRSLIKDNDDMTKAFQAYPGLRALPSADHNGWPATKLGWSDDEVDRILGRKYVPPSSGAGGGVSMAQVNAAIAGSTLTPPSVKS